MDMTLCMKECSIPTTLFSKIDLDIAKRQYPDYSVITAEKIQHDGNRKKIDSRAIIYSPVGNQDKFWTIAYEQICIPQIAIIGLSTSKKAMEEFYTNLKKMDAASACRNSAFGGSKNLRTNLKRMANFLNFREYFGENFEPENMFHPNQNKIFYTQIVKCCSLGKVEDKEDFSNTSAIYPSKVNKNIMYEYLYESGHRKCIEKIFLREMRFSEQIPIILIFKPAWENLKKMELLSELNGVLTDWIPHPSDPGKDVLKLLKVYENNEDINKYAWKKSAKQLIALKEKMNIISKKTYNSF